MPFPKKVTSSALSPRAGVPVKFDYASAVEAAITIKVRTNWIGSLADHGMLANRAPKRILPPMMLILHGGIVPVADQNRLSERADSALIRIKSGRCRLRLLDLCVLRLLDVVRT